MSLDATTFGSTAAHLDAMSVHGDTDSFAPHAELIRTLLEVGRCATLTTTTSGAGRAGPGFPFGSLVAYSVLADGSPLLCISELAEHTRNARADSRAGLLLTGLPVDDESDPLDRPRASLVGRLEQFEPNADEIAAHVERHPGVTQYADFADFGWWRLRIDAARYVGGFGHMSWVSGSDIADAQADAVLAHSRGAIDHMNADHADAVLEMARWIAGIDRATAARVHSIDRHGLTLYASAVGGTQAATARIAFLEGALASPDNIRTAVVALSRRARDIAEATR